MTLGSTNPIATDQISVEVGTQLAYWNNPLNTLFPTEFNSEADDFPNASAHSQAPTLRFVPKTRANRCT